MANLITKESISLKDHPEINEAMIQQFIFDNPSVLELGELEAITREKVQPAGGKLDMLLANSDNNERYEVEIQLGATDPSHIIRTIEYWDTERKRYPQYDHCAVIVAENITARFLNVIQLFNGNIPLIALQMKAYKADNNDVQLTFTRVVDRLTLASDEEEHSQPTDRKYWETRSTPRVMKLVDEIYNDVVDMAPGYTLNYTKFYVGLVKNNIVRNFILFVPKKQFVWLQPCMSENSELTRKLDDAGIEHYYDYRNGRYWVKVSNSNDYGAQRELIVTLIRKSIDEQNINQK